MHRNASDCMLKFRSVGVTNSGVRSTAIGLGPTCAQFNYITGDEMADKGTYVTRPGLLNGPRSDGSFRLGIYVHNEIFTAQNVRTDLAGTSGMAANRTMYGNGACFFVALRRR